MNEIQHELIEEAEGLINLKINSRPKLYAALTTAARLRSVIDDAARHLKAFSELFDELCDKCADYALKNEKVFDGPMVTRPDGTRTGDITLDDVVCHLKHGLGKVRRLDEGEQLNQAFLATLPKDFVKTELKLSVAGRSLEELRQWSMNRPEQSEWSFRK